MSLTLPGIKARKMSLQVCLRSGSRGSSLASDIIKHHGFNGSSDGPSSRGSDEAETELQDKTNFELREKKSRIKMKKTGDNREED